VDRQKVANHTLMERVAHQRLDENPSDNAALISFSADRLP
jgi:hypothetical protein